METRSNDRHVEGIMHCMKDYMGFRVAQAVRVNPRIISVIEDIVFFQMANLRESLRKNKALGGEKMRVADVLLSDDETRRKQLLTQSDNNCVFHELLNRDDASQGRVAEVAIHDMRTLFRALDPSLENIVQLVQHFILWDLADAVDLFHFEEQAARLQASLNGPISDEERARYKAMMRRPPDAPLPPEEAIIAYNVKRLEAIAHRFNTRRNEEEGYQAVVRRDELPTSSVNQAVMRLAAHLGALQKLDTAGEHGELEPALREYFSRALALPAEAVTVTQAREHEQRQIAHAKLELAQLLPSDRSASEPYDYKRHQAHQMSDRLRELLAQVPAAEG